LLVSLIGSRVVLENNKILHNINFMVKYNNHN